ncbi:LysR family transcriptional regulator [Aurantimonas sp. 22II-16-19i]|uniref:LysR family transcriptional regulator n=1 Tax=Aurantimonas sp. 22II-16-19i TaxID=1317114 RepID=UPI0009F7B247|nr:LysR family transcriptional regulator [Aurantimonas sp. 22II-16-19i]ORE89876.1 transcriptional regulatory protein [Aurantimonas sp. 22II-16-19i]
MDQIDQMRLFARVVETRSFTVAAGDLGLSRSTATDAIKRLEARLATQLLTRTTRHVAPTPDGEAYYRRCLQILDEIDDADAMFADVRPKGRLRIDVHPRIAMSFILPHLDAFFALYPEIELFIGEGDRMVDLVREGVDCVLRAGELDDSSMIARRLAFIREVTVASPAYLAKTGTPRSVEDLTNHEAVGFVSSRTGTVLPLEFTVEGQVRSIALPARITVNGSEVMADLARRGFGLVQAPYYRFAADLAAGTLVEVLPESPPQPTPLVVLYPRNRQLSRRVRVFIDWVATRFPGGAI